MHCSSFKPLLDGYVEGQLSPARAARVAAHAESCPDCSALLQELRVIDGLLLSPRQLDPAPNFTFKIMAEARSMPAPHVQRFPHGAMLVTYIAFAWIAIGGFALLGGRAAHAMLAFVGAWAQSAIGEAGRVATWTGHVFGAQSIDVTAAMGGLIALDVAAAVALFAGYAWLRSRRAGLEGDLEC